MKRMKRIAALLLVLTMVLTLTTTAMAANKIKADMFVMLKRNATAYSAAKASKATKSVAMKGSTGYVNKVSGKYAKVVVNAYSGKTVFFKLADLQETTQDSILVAWVKGGDGMSSAVKGSVMSFSPEKKKVKATGNTTLRKGYSLSYKAGGDVKKGEVLKYLGYAGYDDRMVVWYKVRYKNNIRWISSLFSKLI